jgi:cytochrome c551/c552
MKRKYFPFSLLIALSLLAGIIGGCEGPEGPPGPPGESSIAHLEGFAENINCGDCHNPDQDTVNYVWAKKYQWELSKHFFGGDFERNTASCAGCHTTEGFIEAMQGRDVTTHIDASPPGCFACHSPHARGNFSLREESPVILNETVAGSGEAMFDYGKGNLCAQCHKPRTLSPLPNPTRTAATDTITITSSRWYPHYGVQSQMLMGTGGFQFANYTYTGNSNHTDNTVIKQEGCISCHMADANAGSGIAGGHTMNINYTTTSGQPAYLLNGCTTSGCHTSAGFSVDYIGSSAFLTNGMGTHSATEALMDSLHTLLLDRGWITASGSINASGSNPLKIAPADKAGALFNYFFVEHDLSKGSHNTRYTLELLLSSIEALQ